MKKIEKGVIAGFQGDSNIYVDKGHSMKVFKSLNQLTYGKLKVGDSYLVDASYGLNLDNLKKCKLKEIRDNGSYYLFIFELTEYDEDLKIIETTAHYLYDKSIAYAYNFIIEQQQQESFNNLNITTIKNKNEKIDMLFNLTIDSNGKITSLKKKFKYN